MIPDVSLIIVSWNVRDALQQNLRRLFELRGEVSFEAIVVDNSSSDGTPAMLRQHFPNVELIQNDINRGFAYACNQGLKRARGRILILFNPDMLLGEGVLEHVTQTLQTRRDVGVMGVRLLRPDGALVASVRRDPQLVDQLSVLLKVAKLFPSTTRRYLAVDVDYGKSQVVEQIRGSFFAFRCDVYEQVGELDDKRFFIWFEEVDFCRRVREAGYVIWYSSEVSCTDLVGQSFKQQRLAVKQARFSRSMARYFWKWHGWRQGALVYAIRPLVIFFAFVAERLRFGAPKI